MAADFGDLDFPLLSLAMRIVRAARHTTSTIAVAELNEKPLKSEPVLAAAIRLLAINTRAFRRFPRGRLRRALSCSLE